MILNKPSLNNNVSKIGHNEKYVVQQSARHREPLPQDVVKFRKPKSLPDPPGRPNLLMMLPMLVMAVSTGGISYYVASQNPNTSGSMRAFVGVVPMMLMATMMIGIQYYMHRRAIKDHKIKIQQINQSYENHLQQTKENLETYATAQYRISQQENPSFRELERRVKTNARNIWERQPNDDDFLAVCVGTANLPICVDIKTPEPDDDDIRLAQAFEVAEKMSTVDGLPLVVNLNRLGTVGVQGRRSEALYAVFTMVANLSVHQSPDAVHLYIFSHRPHAALLWGWARWLPHTGALHSETNVATRLSFLPETDEPMLIELGQILRQRADGQRNMSEKFDRPEPHLVILFDQVPELQGHKVINMLLSHHPNDDKNTLRASAIFVDQPIPPQISAMVNVQEYEVSYRETWTSDANQIHHLGRAELVNAKQMESLARRMAPLHTETSLTAGAGTLPSNVRLVEMLKATSPIQIKLQDLYQQKYNPRHVLQFPIGIDTDLKPLEIKLRETGLDGHGTHAMLAGMTGTGKSVLLQAMVLSMALTNSPAHLNIVMADFKGGASELAKLQELPHVVGFVTDLNEALLERFLVALESEVVRRKTLFDNAKATLGRPVANIRSYNKVKADDLLPHLVIFLDEFAYGLKKSDNLRKTMRIIAAQGRALGIHMVLSTQRAADFDGEIKANCDVRMSLRVASSEDSKTMFNRPEAYSQLQRPGQAYLQVGDNEIFEMFQSARADISYEPDGTRNLKLLDDFTINRVALDGRHRLLYKHQAGIDQDNGNQQDSVLSEAEVLVHLVQKYCAGKYDSPRIICLPALPEASQLPLFPMLDASAVYNRWRHGIWEDNPDTIQRLKLPLGMLDIPSDQEQRPYWIDLNDKDGNFAVIGPAGAGKALFLQSLILGLAATHTPEDLNIYVLGRGLELALFEELPHCGAVIQASESERLTRLFKYLNKTVQERRRQMARARVAGMAELRKVEPDLYLPAILLVFEDFSGFRVEHEDKLTTIQKLAGDARSVDLHLVIGSTSINTIHTRIQENLRNRLALGLDSAMGYMDVLGKRMTVLGEINGRGYALADQDVLEVQVASPARRLDLEPDSSAAGDEVREIVATMDRNWKGNRPQIIEILPKHIPLESLWERQPASNSEPQRLMTLPIGITYDALESVALDFDRLESITVLSGPPQSGKTEWLVTVCLAAAKSMSPDQLEIIILGPRRNHLNLLQALPHVTYAQSAVQMEQLLKDLNERLKVRVEDFRDQQAHQVERQTSQIHLLPKQTMIIIDDLQRVMRHDALHSLVDSCYATGREIGIFLFLADTGNNFNQLKSQHFNIQFIQSAFKLGCGVAFSTDANDLTPLGLNFKIKTQTLQLHEPHIGQGRGFFSYQGKEEVVQFATVGRSKCDEGEYRESLKNILIDQSQMLQEMKPEKISTVAEMDVVQELLKDSTLDE